MAVNQSFEDIALDRLRPIAQRCADEGWRAVQVLGARGEVGVDVTYTFEREGEYHNLRVRGVTKDDEVPSLQDLFLALFPFENELAELFGVTVTGMALDFGGALYSLAENEPMMVVTKEQNEARKAASSKAVEQASAPTAAAPETPAAAAASVLTDEEIEAKVAKVPEDKREQIRAALKARQAKQMAAAGQVPQQAEQPSVPQAPQPRAKLEIPEIEVPAAQDAPEPAPSAEAPQASANPDVLTDEQIEAKVANLPADKADLVRTALKAKRDAALAAEKAGE